MVTNKDGETGNKDIEGQHFSDPSSRSPRNASLTAAFSAPAGRSSRNASLAACSCRVFVNEKTPAAIHKRTAAGVWSLAGVMLGEFA